LGYGLKLVVLDYDLTLFNNLYDFYIAFNESLTRHTGKSISFEEFYERLLNDKLSELVSSESWSVWRDMRKKICVSRYSYLNRGVEWFLYMTSYMGLKKIIVSGRECHSRYIWLDLMKHGIDEYIDAVYTFYDMYLFGGVEEELFDKKWLLKYILEKYHVEPVEAVYIGDYKLDYYNSLELGLWFIGFSAIDERIECLKRLGARFTGRDFYEVFYNLLEISRKIRR